MRIDREQDQPLATTPMTKESKRDVSGVHVGQHENKTLMSLSAFGIQGNRNHMEDYFDIGYQMKPLDQRRPNEWPYEYFYFGIFDGHGGAEASCFAKKNLLRCITSQKCFWSNDDEEVKRSIQDGFAKCHAEMRKSMPKWPRTGSFLPSTAGTTASVLFIKNGKFYTGHVGDSRIVISRENSETKQWISHQITEDHKPESESETKRIQRAGGEVKSKIGVHRVVWKRPVYNDDIDDKLYCTEQTPDRQEVWDSTNMYPLDDSLVESYQSIPFLAIARSLGDFWSLNPYSGQYIVSPEPDVTCRPIDSNDKCILLATDGLWNVMNSSQVVRILQELDIIKNDQRQYHNNEYFTIDNYYDIADSARQNHAQSICCFAYQVWGRRRLRSDNITVVVAMLHDILQYFHEPSSNKIYKTRACGINQANEVTHSEEKHKLCHEHVQINEATNYQEKVYLGKEPTLDISDGVTYMDFSLNLPPTIINPYRDRDFPFSNPRNYQLLALAQVRKIPRDDKISPHRDSETLRSESYILIKEVSDDPADNCQLPTRKSASGKTVRDASAQATQSMHDFGQPWDQLYNEIYMKSDEELEKDALEHLSEEDIKETDKIFYRLMEKADHEPNDKEYYRTNDGDAYETNDRDDVDDNEDEELDLAVEAEIESRALDLVARTAQEEKKSIPQLRCLLNYTPPLRRSQRHTYQSLSDNSKRKVQVPNSDNVPLHKSKRRRKSQPIRRNLTRI